MRHKLNAAIMWVHDRELWMFFGVLIVLAGAGTFFLTGCAAGSSSTITPAKSTAEQKTLTVTAPARHSRRLIVRVPAAVPSPVVEEDVE